MLNTPKIKFIYFIYFFTSLFFINNIQSQCAGISNSVTICNKESDSNNQNFNLFNQLSGSPQAGGVWKSNSPLNQKALNTNSGIVNLWLINRSGSHSFTYTNSNCSESATVTIDLGGYAGEGNVNGGANACSTNSKVDLYTFLDNNLGDLNPDINGEWEEALGTQKGFLTGQFFNAAAAGVGTYTFRYTVNNADNVDRVASCTSKFAEIMLEIHRAPQSGTAENITICATEDFSAFTNISLFNQLTDEDNDGIWSDESGTNQISDALDSTINIQEIYNTFGSGNYDFSYTVSQTHGVCSESISTVTISIPEIKGQFQVNNQFKENPLIIEILNTNSNNSTFSYDLEYEIRNTATNELVHTATLTNTVNRTNNTVITLPPNTVNKAGEYRIKSTKISNITGLTCTSLEVLENQFVIYDTQATIPKLCFNGTDALITISNLVDNNGEQSNNTYTIDYTIEDAINKSSRIVENQEISFTNGTGIVSVDISSFPKNTIDYNLKINSPTENGFENINFDFSASLVPKDIQLDFKIDSVCNATEIEAIINAPSLYDGAYTISYEISEESNTTILSDSEIVLVDGITNYSVDISTLKTGSYKVVLKSSQNDTDPCRTQFEFDKTLFFSINGSPIAPTLEANQSFCFNSNPARIEPKIADIIVTTGENLIWYGDNTSTTPLDETTLLVDGEDYFVASMGFGNSCKNSDRAPVVIKFNKPSLITSKNTKPVFCAIENATLANLDASANLGTVVWYDAITGGNLLETTTLLENGKEYFAAETIDACEFDTRLPFNVTILANEAQVAPTLDANQTFCFNSSPSASMPTIADISITTGTNLTWYEGNTSTMELDVSTLLVDGEDYFVTASNSSNKCQNSVRSSVVIEINIPSLVVSNNVNPTFCAINNTTIANLNATANTGTIKWYDSMNGGNLLETTTLLENGKEYFATESINGCEYDTRLQFNVSISTIKKPEFSGTNLLCSLDNLALFDLEKDILVDSNSTLIWYTSLEGNTEIDSSEILQENTDYYAVAMGSNCQSERLLINVSLSNCDPTNYDFFIPDGFSPNGDGNNDVYYIKNIETFYPDYEFEIFNRYGQTIFKINKNNPVWNGENFKTGKSATTGVYFYVLNYNKNNIKAKQGRIFLSK